MEHTVELRKVSVGYKVGNQTHPVLKNLDINFRKGEMTCVMGPNGIGKSTLIRTIAGLQPRLDGQISIFDKDIDEMSMADLAREISVVLTTIPYVGNLSVGQIVEMGRYPFTGLFHKLTELDLELIEKSIRYTGVDPIRSKKFSALSDGQKQKTLIARALAQNGKILILDEPTSHLDLNNRVEIMKLLKDLASEDDKTIIISTHEMDLALQITDRLLLINSNGGIETGIPEDLVLNESIDDTFRLKGYDLKRGTVTGRILTQSVCLKGEDYPLLWTKNALARSGFKVVDDADITISIIWNKDRKDAKIQWKVVREESDKILETVEDLLIYLQSIIKT